MGLLCSNILKTKACAKNCVIASLFWGLNKMSASTFLNATMK